MRTTIHLVARADFWPFALAVRDVRRARGCAPGREPHAPAMAGAARDGAQPAHGRRELRRAELDALVGKERALGVGLWVDLVRVPPSGTWERRRADRFALAEDWVGPPPRRGAERRRAHLVRRYLAAFGPASRKDVASFTGSRCGRSTAILAGVELRRFASEDGEELLDVPGGPLPDPDTPAPPRYLPTWDATLLTHARRTGVLPEEHRPRLFSTKTPQSFPTFLVDGAVAGTWRHADGEVVLAVRAARPARTGRRCATRRRASPRSTPDRRGATATGLGRPRSGRAAPPSACPTPARLGLAVAATRPRARGRPRPSGPGRRSASSAATARARGCPRPGARRRARPRAGRCGGRAARRRAASTHTADASSRTAPASCGAGSPWRTWRAT